MYTSHHSRKTHEDINRGLTIGQFIKRVGIDISSALHHCRPCSFAVQSSCFLFLEGSL